MILNVRLLLTSGENSVEVANRRKVKNMKGQIFGFLFFFGRSEQHVRMRRLLEYNNPEINSSNNTQ